MKSVTGIDINEHKKPMPQTVEAWRKYVDGLEKIMLEDKAEISRLKCKINKLEQKNNKRLKA